MRRTAPALALALLPLAGSAFAGGLEMGVHAGATAPTYEQSFRYDPRWVGTPLPGVTVVQRGTFGLEAEGGLALGATLAWSFAGPLGAEARLDTADIELTTQPGTYDVRVDVRGPLSGAIASLALGGGPADVERVRPLSLNLRLRTPGTVALTVSGGLSYLPELRFSTTQTVGLGPAGVSPEGRLEVITLPLRVEAQPGAEGQSRWGGNLGAGVRVALGARLALTVEARAFRFKEQTLSWARADDRPLSPLESAALLEVQARLPPVEFRPAFYQGTAGLALVF